MEEKIRDLFMDTINHRDLEDKIQDLSSRVKSLEETGVSLMTKYNDLKESKQSIENRLSSDDIWSRDIELIHYRRIRKAVLRGGSPSLLSDLKEYAVECPPHIFHCVYQKLKVYSESLPYHEKSKLENHLRDLHCVLNGVVLDFSELHEKIEKAKADGLTLLNYSNQLESNITTLKNRLNNLYTVGSEEDMYNTLYHALCYGYTLKGGIIFQETFKKYDVPLHVAELARRNFTRLVEATDDFQTLYNYEKRLTILKEYIKNVCAPSS